MGREGVDDVAISHPQRELSPVPVAGARFGAGSLPERWLATLAHREDVTLLGRALATTEFKISE